MLEVAEVEMVSGGYYEPHNWDIKLDGGDQIIVDGGEIVVNGQRDPFAWAIADWVQRHSSEIGATIGSTWAGTLGGLVGYFVGDAAAQQIGDYTYAIIHNEDSFWKDLYNAAHGDGRDPGSGGGYDIP